MNFFQSVPTLRYAGPIVLAVFGALLLVFAAAEAQEEDVSSLAVPDSVFDQEMRQPIMYSTRYDRDHSWGTWQQSLGFNRTKRRFSSRMSGDLTTTDDILRNSYNSIVGNMAGRVDFRATRRWIFSLDGHSDMASLGDVRSNSDQRRNRFLAQTQYVLSPSPRFQATGVLLGEYQMDHNLNTRPANKVDTLSQYDPVGDSLMTQLFQVHDQRDSSRTSGRRDAAAVTGTWRPWSGLETYGATQASRARPTTRTVFRDFTTEKDSSGEREFRTLQTTSANNENVSFQTRATYTGTAATKIEANLRKMISDQSRYDPQLRGQEQTTLDRRSGTILIQRAPFPGGMVIINGSMARSLSQFTLRSASNNLAKTSALSTIVGYDSKSTHGYLTFDASRAKTERTSSQDGVVLNRRLTANAQQRVSARLKVESLASISLDSYQYVLSASDQDEVRSLANVGAGYAVSPRCSTTVHFSTTRSHGIFIDPSRSGTNATTTNYLMNATLDLRLGSGFSLKQSYALSAEYKIFDYAEDQNNLNRVRRVDTGLTDSLCSFAYLTLTHNFAFRDRGSYTRDEAGQDRLYRVSVERYEQTLAVTAGLRPTSGIRVVVTQSLASTQDNVLFPKSRQISNRWNLTGGVEIDQPLSETASIRGAIRHIGGYNEKTAPNVQPNEDNYWISSISFDKSF